MATQGPAAQLRELMGRESAKTRLRRLASHAPAAFNPVCPHTTETACRECNEDACSHVHFQPIMRPYTDPSLGHCSYLNMCYGEPLFAGNPSLGESGGGTKFGTKECRYLHFQVTPAAAYHTESPPLTTPIPLPAPARALRAPPRPGTAQWVNCDIRNFDFSVLGQFQVIVADPPWDIHMSLPYGTMTDDEMRSLPLASLQPDWGILALWVTGRAMELARELLNVWGYERVDELVWLKTNQLQRLIRTGRTGHWLNHTCEHLLVALKRPVGWPKERGVPWEKEELRALRRGVDTDVVVAEVRETSRKPDEVYGVIERLAPHGRKLELFGRKHNIRPGWLTLGNQLRDSQITEPDLHARLCARYPDQTFTLVQ
ncbi:hypothetical protein CspHIS471_0210940 [Cutaneotrichosporon sp. HIS471]|nr:hypothetical protein CspHIS471_0210940 [Cutaneotrichosporon sp. HIS471]